MLLSNVFHSSVVLIKKDSLNFYFISLWCRSTCHYFQWAYLLRLKRWMFEVLLTMLLSSKFHSSVVLMKNYSLYCGVLQSMMSKHVSLFRMRLSTMLEMTRSCFVVVLIFLRLDLTLVRNIPNEVKTLTSIMQRGKKFVWPWQESNVDL